MDYQMDNTEPGDYSVHLDPFLTDVNVITVEPHDAAATPAVESAGPHRSGERVVDAGRKATENPYESARKENAGSHRARERSVPPTTNSFWFTAGISKQSLTRFFLTFFPSPSSVTSSLASTLFLPSLQSLYGYYTDFFSSPADPDPSSSAVPSRARGSRSGSTREDDPKYRRDNDSSRSVMSSQSSFRAREQIRAEKERLEKEKRAEKLEEQHDSLRQKLREEHGRYIEVASRNRVLDESVLRLRGEVKTLEAELEEARSHIFSLQPYRKELTPKEVESDFDNLMGMIDDWVNNFCEPIIEDQAKCEQLVAAAREHRDEFLLLEKYVASCPDLMRGSMYPDTDIDILTAVVMRYVYNNVFRHDVFGSSSELGKAVHFIATAMRDSAEPKRDEVAVRTWQAEAFSAILSSPNYKKERDDRVISLALEMTAALKPFGKEKDESAIFESFQNSVIVPAVLLHEKFLTSTHHFYLEMEPYMTWSKDGIPEALPSFLDELRAEKKLDCRNIMQNRSPLRPPKPGVPPPTRAELERNTENVLTLTPGLFMRRVGGEGISAMAATVTAPPRLPTTIRKQQMLVASASPEAIDQFISSGSPTLMRRLFPLQVGPAESPPRY